MDTCRLAVFRIASASAAEFVGFWSRTAFRDPSRKTYAQNILEPGSPTTYDLARVTRLMEWKAGRLAKTAPALAKKVDLDALNEFRSKPFSTAALEEFWRSAASRVSASEGSIVWPAFLCHIAHPEAVPFYDVSSWQAWNFIAGALNGRGAGQRPPSFENYLAYREFFYELADQSGADQAQLESALSAFGQFLASATTSSHLLAEIDRFAAKCDAGR